MATSKDRSAQRVLIDFSSSPIHCRSCGAAMRPSEGITNGWPTSTTPYGRSGERKSCAAPAAAEAGPTGAGEAAAVEPAPSPAKAITPTPKVVARRRPRHRFDYRPPQEDLCFSCGRPINPLTGECRCSD